MIGLVRPSKAGKLIPAVIIEFLEKLYYRYGFRRVCLAALLIAYSFLGGALFHYLEEPNAMILLEQAKADTLQRRSDFAVQLVASTRNACLALTMVNFTEINETTRDDCWYKLYHAAVTKHEAGLKLNDGILAYNWDFWNAMFYSATLYTTIGYGHLYCRTFWGQFATILYASIGIPLLLMILNDLGTLFAGWLKRAWAALVQTFRKFTLSLNRKRKVSEVAANQIHKNPAAASNDWVEPPLTDAFGILWLYICVCAAIFRIWETKMDYFTAFYFFFMSLTTIGLGDIIIEHPRYTLFGFGFFLVGLALVSMCINTIQTRFERAFESAAERLLERLERIEALQGARGPSKRPSMALVPTLAVAHADGVYAATRSEPVGQEKREGPADDNSHSEANERNGNNDNIMENRRKSTIASVALTAIHLKHLTNHSANNPHAHDELRKHIEELEEHIKSRQLQNAVS